MTDITTLHNQRVFNTETKEVVSTFVNRYQTAQFLARRTGDAREVLIGESRVRGEWSEDPQIYVLEQNARNREASNGKTRAPKVRTHKEVLRDLSRACQLAATADEYTHDHDEVIESLYSELRQHTARMHSNV